MLIRLMRDYLRPYRKWLGLVLVFQTIQTLATLTKNTVRVPNSTATFDKLANPTPSQDRALQLLSLRATL